MRRSVAAVPGIRRVSAQDLVTFVQICDRLGIDPDWLAAVISFESGWDPSIQNPKSNATGLIQFMPGVAKRLGVASDKSVAAAKLKAMSIAEQLPWVERYFRPHAGRMKSLSSVYAAVFGPGANSENVLAPDDRVIYRAPSAEYRDNAGLDKGNKGYITKADLASAAQSRLDAARSARIEVNLDAVAVASASNTPVLILAMAFGWLATDWYTRRYGLALPTALQARLRSLTR